MLEMKGLRCAYRDGVCRIDRTVDEIDAPFSMTMLLTEKRKGSFFRLLARLFLVRADRKSYRSYPYSGPDGIRFAYDEFLDDGRPSEHRTDIQVDDQLLERHKYLVAFRLLDLEPRRVRASVYGFRPMSERLTWRLRVFERVSSR